MDLHGGLTHHREIHQGVNETSLELTGIPQSSESGVGKVTGSSKGGRNEWNLRAVAGGFNSLIVIR